MVSLGFYGSIFGLGNSARSLSDATATFAVHYSTCFGYFSDTGHGGYTGALRLTPHHKTGARFVAQSKVNKLISQMMISTGIGARSTSVLLRKGKA